MKMTNNLVVYGSWRPELFILENALQLVAQVLHKKTPGPDLKAVILMVDEAQLLLENDSRESLLRAMIRDLGCYMCSTVETSPAVRDNLLIIPLIAGTIAPSVAPFRFTGYFNKEISVNTFTRHTIATLLRDPISGLPHAEQWLQNARFTALASVTCPLGRALEYFVHILRDPLMQLDENLTDNDLANIEQRVSTTFTEKYPVESMMRDLGGAAIVDGLLSLVLGGFQAPDELTLTSDKSVSVEQLVTKGYVWRDTNGRLILPFPVLKALISRVNFQFTLPAISTFTWQDFENILVDFQVCRVRFCSHFSPSLQSLFSGASASNDVWNIKVHYSRDFDIVKDERQCVTKGEQPVYEHPRSVERGFFRRCLYGNPTFDGAIYLREAEGDGYVLILQQYRHKQDDTQTDVRVSTSDIQQWYLKATKIAVPCNTVPTITRCLYMYITNKQISDRNCLNGLLHHCPLLLVVTRDEFKTFFPSVIAELAALLPNDQPSTSG